ncbi:MAG: holo-ACP synthase [Verrucomicrobiota bacterium]
MEVYGIGIDVVETDRIRRSLERFGDRFLGRIYLPGELAYCQSMKFPPLHLAARFAAKEAISKAFGTGIGQTIGWKDLEIIKAQRGAPQVVLHGGAREFADACGVTRVLCSLTHTEHYAAANAVAVRE